MDEKQPQGMNAVQSQVMNLVFREDFVGESPGPLDNPPRAKKPDPDGDKAAEEEEHPKKSATDPSSPSENPTLPSPGAFHIDHPDARPRQNADSSRSMATTGENNRLLPPDDTDRSMYMIPHATVVDDTVPTADVGSVRPLVHASPLHEVDPARMEENLPDASDRQQDKIPSGSIVLSRRNVLIIAMVTVLVIVGLTVGLSVSLTRRNSGPSPEYYDRPRPPAGSSRDEMSPKGPPPAPFSAPNPYPSPYPYAAPYAEPTRYPKPTPRPKPSDPYPTPYPPSYPTLLAASESEAPVEDRNSSGGGSRPR